MTVIEKKSLRKRKAILSLVEKGEYSPAYALMLVEELSDNGKLTEEDYEYLAEYLESLLYETEEEIQLSNQNQIDENLVEEIMENE